MSTKAEEVLAVARFSTVMLWELRENSDKAHWSTCSRKWLLNRLRGEVGELTRAINRGEGWRRIVSEAADVANFAMMIVFQLDRDPETVPREPGEVVPAVLALCPAHRRTDDGGD